MLRPLVFVPHSKVLVESEYKGRGSLSVSVIPAKAGIQANSAQNQPGFPRQPEADPSEAFGGCAE